MPATVRRITPRSALPAQPWPLVWPRRLVTLEADCVKGTLTLRGQDQPPSRSSSGGLAPSTPNGPTQVVPLKYFMTGAAFVDSPHLTLARDPRQADHWQRRDEEDSKLSELSKNSHADPRQLRICLGGRPFYPVFTLNSGPFAVARERVGGYKPAFQSPALHSRIGLPLRGSDSRRERFGGNCADCYQTAPTSDPQ